MADVTIRDLAFTRRSAVVLSLAFAVEVLLSSALWNIAEAAEPKPSLPDLVLRDHLGTEHALREFDECRGVVLAFIGAECPLARLYALRLTELQTRYAAQGIVIYGVDSNVQDSLSEVASFARRNGISFPILMDNAQRLCDAVGAQRTPEVFLFDPQGGLQYRGRVDDQYAIGVQRSAPTREDLAIAIDELLAGQKVTVPETRTVGCFIGRPNPVEPHGEITYSGQVAAILDRRCVECHREGEIAPFPLTTYEETIGWGATMAEVIEEGRMPPWNANPEHGRFSNDVRLSESERATLLTWIRNGSPQGDPAERPTPPEFVSGWRIGEPDLIVPMRDKPFPVPADGVVNYQYFEVAGFDEERYVSAVEARPGNRSVVHHIIVYMRSPEHREKKRPGQMLVGYAHGTPPSVYAAGEAIKVPAGWQLMFELHYTPNGRPQEDLSYVGLRFADPMSIVRTIDGGAAVNSKFRIPPGADHHVVTAEEVLAHDIDLISLTPHMHLRGKSFRYEAVLPDGQRDTLLDVPEYDFNWQLRYELAERRRLPKGTRILCTATFDNSDGNPNNPDPASEVTWGEQSWDEMMIGFYTCVRP